MKMCMRALAALFSVLFLSGCLELLRRPQEGSGASYAWAARADSLGAPGNPSAAANVQDSTSSSTSSSGEEAPLVRIERPGRTSRERETIQQVNEYALWCIQNSMWNEARTHMERALAQDSLSASLHNNLAIVYERLGMRDEAARFYRQAQALDPGQKAYRANLRRLEHREQAATDTAQSIDIFEFKRDSPRDLEPAEEDEGDSRESPFTGD